LAEETGGLYLPAETEDQLADALRKTLTCPLTTDNREAPRLIKTVEIPIRLR
jgi:hypothetical protein